MQGNLTMIALPLTINKNLRTATNCMGDQISCSDAPFEASSDISGMM